MLLRSWYKYFVLVSLFFQHLLKVGKMLTVYLEIFLTFQKTALDDKCIDFPFKKSADEKNNWLTEHY